MLNPTGRTVVVEVKVLRRNDASFPFDRITPEQHKWFLEHLELMHRVFAKRIKVLDAGEYQEKLT